MCYLHAYPQAHPALRHGFSRKRRASGEGEPPLIGLIIDLRLRLYGLFAYMARPELTVRERLTAYRVALKGLRRVARLAKEMAESPDGGF